MRQIYLDPGENNHVKNISLYTNSEGYISFVNWIGYTLDSGKTYVQKNITLFNVDYNGYFPSLTFGFGIRGVKAFNKDTVLVYGDYAFEPCILYSTDQCNTFKLIYYSPRSAGDPLTSAVADMIFPQNSATGYAVQYGKILKTTNRGKTWVSIWNTPGKYFDHLEGTDDLNLYTYNSEADPGNLLKTVNGGTTWTQVAIPQPTRVISASFISPLKGWINIGGYNQPYNTYYTSNGGTSWTQKNNTLANQQGLFDMTFVNDSTGYGIDGLYAIYKTTDSGRIWQPIPRDLNFTYLGFSHDVLFAKGNSLLWAGGMHGLVELTTNGGGQTLPTPRFYFDTTGVYATKQVKLVNWSKPIYQYKWYLNGQLISTNFNASYTHDFTRGVDSVRLEVSDGSYIDSFTAIQFFTVPLLPKATSFTPMAGGTGTLVTINGDNFSPVTSVSFGGVPAASFTIESPTKIIALVGAGASGDLSLASFYYTSTLPGFTYVPEPSSQRPLITCISPNIAKAGSPVTITGMNFNAAPSGNIVWFGDVKANVTASTSTQINCIIPASAKTAPVAILNTSTHLQGASLVPYAIVFADSSNFTPNSFIVSNIYGYGETLTTAAVPGDFDGDGKTDLVSGVGNNMLVYRNITNNGVLTFDLPKTIGTATTAGAQRMDIKDIDNDGKVDIVVNTYGPTIKVYRNTSVPGSISFDPMVILNVSGQSIDVTTVDLDGDGRIDIVGSDMSVLRNTGAPGSIAFTKFTNYNTGSGSGAGRITADDLDGDGKPDIVVLTSSAFSYYKNTGTPGNISLAPKVQFPVSGEVFDSREIRLADYDGDGKLDVIILNESNIHFLRNTGTLNNFSVAADVTLPPNRNSLAVGNLSGGVRPDINVGPALYRNTSIPGQISHDPVTGFGGTFSLNTNIADYNGDGRPDISQADYGANRIVVFTNSIGLPLSKRICTAGSGPITSDIAGASYQWQFYNGSTYVDVTDNANLTGSKTVDLNLTNIPDSWNGYRYRCRVGNFYSSIYELKVGPRKPEITATVPSLNFCKGNPVTFTATATEAGPAPAFKWQINEIDVNPAIVGFSPDFKTFTAYDLKDNDRVRALVRSSDGCSSTLTDTSDVFVMKMAGEYTAVTVDWPTVVCGGVNTTFTATPVNGGTNPTYEWYINSTLFGTGPVFTTNQVLNDYVVSVRMRNNATSCAAPGEVYNTYRASVLPMATPSITILTPTNQICTGNTVTFQTNTTGNITLYQWQVNNANVGSNTSTFSSSTLANGDQVKLTVTTNRACITQPTATSNIISMMVASSYPVSASFTAPSVVAPDTYLTLRATIVNGGLDPTLRWEDSTAAKGGWNQLPFFVDYVNYIPKATGDKIRFKVISGLNCGVPKPYYTPPHVFTINSVTAIDPVSAASQGIVYYPNPVQNEFIIDSLKLSDQWETVEVFDLNGKRMLSSINIRNRTKVFLNTGHLPGGMYVAELRRKKGFPAYLRFLRL